ncbi:uncharacterized protein LOC121379889 isoform X2 [Gigantopelta aegis]|nr:uncharacterized protein LOC121379889 isoform X2 [Gigantopelta aegis]
MKTKTKFWCSLEGHVMHLFKNNKKVYSIESLNLTDAQTVRKVTSDKSGMQFEIIMKKNKKHVFTALTPSECSTWIKELQSLMIAQPVAEISRLSQFSVGDTGNYTSLDVLDDLGADNSVKTVLDSTIKPSVDSDYAEIQDLRLHQTDTSPDKREHEDSKTQNLCADQTHTSPDTTCSDYTEIQDVRHLQSHTSDAGSSTQSTISTEDAASVDTRHLQTIDPSSQYAFTEEVYTDAATKRLDGEVDQQHNDVYAIVSKKAKECTDVEEVVDKVLDVFEDLSFTKPIPLIPLEKEDYKPLRDLKEFLDNNKVVCRYSSGILLPNEDPIERMKEILEDVG